MPKISVRYPTRSRPRPARWLVPAWLLLITAAAPVSAATIWSGPKLTFSKGSFADETDPANQDRITDNVWITRGAVRGIYNARTESAYEINVSPEDTEWAFGTTADLESLTFEPWQVAVNNNPPASTGQDMVVHLITDNIFIDIKFTEWGLGAQGGGSFEYERSTPIPEPATCTLILLAFATLQRRRRSALTRGPHAG